MRLKLLFSLLALSTTLYAQQLADGYYRVHNKATDRYVYVRDNTGSINLSTTSAEMGALELWTDFNLTLSDPASIIYVHNVGEGQYNLSAQGTSVYQIIKYYVKIYPKGDAWQLCAASNGLTKYLADEETTDLERGQMGTFNKGEYRLWIAEPIDMAANYFGIQPTIQIGDSYYKPFYADFAIQLAGTDIKAYYITDTYKHIAVLKQWQQDVVPANTPILLECKSNVPANNKLNLLTVTSGKPADNRLLGVYFDNKKRPKSKDAQTLYNPNTMRVLGKLSNGELGFVVSTKPTLAANEAYLPVAEDTPTELVLMTEEQLEAYKVEEQAAAIQNLKQTQRVNGVFSLTGVKVADQIHNRLPKGVYIVNGRKVTIQ